jgi:hypothetical protein
VASRAAAAGFREAAGALAAAARGGAGSR